jgi:hypothetical protein
MLFMHAIMLPVQVSCVIGQMSCYSPLVLHMHYTGGTLNIAITI